MKKEFEKAVKEKKEMLAILNNAGEPDEIKNLVVRLYFRPVQSLKSRYEYVKTSQKEENFDIFKKVADILADKFTNIVQSVEDKYQGLAYLVNDAYDFEFILSLSRFYQGKRYLLDWHLESMKIMFNAGRLSKWEEAKEFWLSTTVNR